MINKETIESLKKKNMDSMYELFGNPNIKDTKTKALDDKYWEGHQ